MIDAPRRRPAAPLLSLLLAAACGGPDSRPADAGGDASGGTVVVASIGEAENLMPPVITSLAAKQVVDQVYAPLAEMGPSKNTLGDVDFQPRAAVRWTWSPDSSYVDFAMRPGARFHDGHPVTAADVQFSYALYMDPKVASPHVAAFPRIDSISVPDSMTARVYFAERSPERFFKLVVNLTVLPKHAIDSVAREKLGESSPAQHPVGSGPYRFVKWERGVALDLVADTANAEGRPGPDRLIFRAMPDPNAAARAVVAGEADIVELLRPEGMALVTPDVPARTVEYAAPQVGYLLFNTRAPKGRPAPHPALGERELRRALARAIDRAALVANALDSLAVVARGPFTRGSWAADSSVGQFAVDPAGAQRTLDSLGWRDTNGDGVRERNGQALRLTLMVPSTSATRRQMATVLAEQLAKVGVQVTVEALEPSVMLPRLVKGDFDAFIHVWQADATPSSIAQTWGGRDLERSANFGWYANPSVDAAIDKAVGAGSVAAARPLYRDVYEQIVQDAPAVFIWEPRSFALVHKRIKFASLSGDAWWSGIRSWRIPAGERIARDGAGL